jgi:protein-tyrosine-phosphatase
MKNKIFFCLYISLLSISSLQALKNENLLKSRRQEEPKIFINNRILASINGKPISTYDLMKKMDLAFFRQYPEYASSNQARYQFYEYNWKPALSDMIDKQLILADAQESKIEVTSGDVRQEIESSFGPNTIANLDKAGISFEEASKIMQEEIIIRRLLAGRVHAKAMRQVTPSKVRLAYEEFIQDPNNARLTQWSYRMITIKDRTLQKTEALAKTTYQTLMEGVSLEQLAAQLKERKALGRKGKVTVSNIIKHNDKEISKDYREIMMGLEKGMYSQPFAHKSRSNNTTVYRILVVDEKIPGGIPSYKEMEANLKEKLLDQEINIETDNYLLKLRQHYHIRESDLENYLPANYQPFMIK